jgi:predicted extracellular nuclease
LLGSAHTIRGIVTQVDYGSGFTLEEPASDSSEATSNGIHITDEALSRIVRSGQQWQLTGAVSEQENKRDSLTVLSSLTAHQLCASELALPRTEITLPLDSLQREAIESMRVALTGSVSVADVYNFYRGEVLLSSHQPPRVPTEDTSPGQTAFELGQKIHKTTLQAGFMATEPTLLQRGSRFDSLTGVMGHNGSSQLLIIEDELKNALPPPSEPPEVGLGDIRIASMNLLNFFNGDGQGGGFPTKRGARSQDDFIAQSGRIQAAVKVIQPDIIAVQELENDGYGPLSAARTLLTLLNAAALGEWAVVSTGQDQLGADDITVGLFYRADRVEAIGPAETLDTATFIHLSRQPLAQQFREYDSGEQFLIAVNHLKSKGGCPDSGDNADQSDGQGCWNTARMAAASEVAAWAAQLAQTSGPGHAMILGDMNAHRNEDPIQVFRQQAYTEMVEHISGLPQYSYVYRGAEGTLDYAFATPSLIEFVRDASIWHVNADWPQKTALPQPWLRFSDHDPLIVDLDFSQAATSD